MDAAVSEDAREYVKAHGGAVFVRAHPHGCCRGSITLLDTTTEPPPDSDDFVSIDASEIDVRFRSNPAEQPHQLVIELHGLFKRRAVAYWDGCAFKP